MVLNYVLVGCPCGSSPNGQSLVSELGQLYLLPLSQTPFFSTAIKTLHIYIPVSGQLLLRTLFSTAGRVVSAYESVLCTSRGTRWGVLPYQHKPKRHVPPPLPQRVWFMWRFGLKTGVDFAHFGLESGMVFEGTMGTCERFSCFNSK